MTDQILKNDVLGWDIINAVAVDEVKHITFLDSQVTWTMIFLCFFKW